MAPLVQAVAATAELVDPIALLRDGTEVAGWLFKANPAVWDVLGAIEDRNRGGAGGLDSWPMAASYRVDLVRPGHPCVLWVTGGRRLPTTGAWAMGTVTTEPYVDHADPDQARSTDPLRRRALRYHVGVDLDVASEPVALADLVDDGRFERAEIVRAPRVSSPVALTAEEWAAIEDRWPG